MTITRSLKELKYDNKSEEFVLKQKSFQYQYAPLYAERLAKMREEVSKAAKIKWPGHEIVKNLVDLVKSERAVIVGTLFKNMKNKPNILKELAEDDENNGIPIQPVIDRDAKYIDEEAASDEIILEDELQRILLIDAPGSDLIKSNKLCGGIVLAALGYENEESKFEVEEICFKFTEFYAATTHVARPITPASSASDTHICLISGLELGDTTKTPSYMFKFQLLVDFLRGDFIQNNNDDDDDLKSLIKNTTRIIIAGNSLSSTTQSKDMINKAKYLTKNYVVGSVNAIKQLDEMLLELITHLDVDLMPGEFDPSNLMVPQQPLHHAMFTKSIESEYKRSLHSVTNPYRFVLGDKCLLATSGQFIDDMRKSTSIDDPIELMKLSMHCGHLAPTCPDTLACYPYYGQDPFILDHLPDVYLVGNQNEYKHGVYRRDENDAPQGPSVQLISLPKFSTTHSCVFLNLNTLQSREISF